MSLGSTTGAGSTRFSVSSGSTTGGLPLASSELSGVLSPPQPTSASAITRDRRTSSRKSAPVHGGSLNKAIVIFFHSFFSFRVAGKRAARLVENSAAHQVTAPKPSLPYYGPKSNHNFLDQRERMERTNHCRAAVPRGEKVPQNGLCAGVMRFVLIQQRIGLLGVSAFQIAVHGLLQTFRRRGAQRGGVADAGQGALVRLGGVQTLLLGGGLVGEIVQQQLVILQVAAADLVVAALGLRDLLLPRAHQILPAAVGLLVLPLQQLIAVQQRVALVAVAAVGGGLQLG